MTARFIYFAMESLDGYIEDVQGKFEWSKPDEEVHRFVNDLLRPVGTYLYGRRMYETMQVWETEFGKETDPPWTRDFAGLWRAAEKIVFSRSLTHVSTAKTRLERTFDARAVREMKTRAGQDLAMGGHLLAAHAFRAGLIDEVYLLLAPIIVGGGKRALPDDVVLKLELIEQRRFEQSSVAYLRYAIR